MHKFHLWLHKCLHWEYWPSYLVYAPTFIFWLWLAFKYRDWLFFKHSNPAIKNGGFHNDSKYDTYQLLPSHTYPKTILVQANQNPDLEALLQANNLNFPLIAKPDIGYRGKKVQKINNLDSLKTYHLNIGQDYLIQAYADYPNEIGLFYARLPEEEKGQITGLTTKEFLRVTGNGTSTLYNLLQQNPRHAMQIEKLSSKFDLNLVPPKGDILSLVPYGNHNLGTKFMDGKAHITPKLEHTFNQLLRPIKGLNYVRLDIRFKTFEELENAQHFAILEVNGAKSEPTHIYDPHNSFWKGQKEIARHQRLFARIIAANHKLSLKQPT